MNIEKLTASVGRGGINRFKDVATVQTLINDCLHLLGPLRLLQVDGKVGAITIDTIELFQKNIMKMERADGRVDPGGKTLMALNLRKTTPRTVLPVGLFKDIWKPFYSVPSVASYKFPLANRPVESYKTGMRRFGSSRKRGRLHAACDLYATIGTDVFALDDGVVEKEWYPFYLGTYAIEINHPDFLARYGELGTISAGLTKGAKVKKGQIIGTVGELRDLNMSMLHLELYSGKLTGRLTDENNSPYQRRSDLMDPTPVLDKAK